MNKEYLEKLALLAVKSGVNVQPDQILVVSAPIEAAELVRLINKEAYRTGARDVIIRYSDGETERERYLHANPEVFKECPEWKAALLNDTAADGACYISITGNDPHLMQGVNPENPTNESLALRKKAVEYRRRLEQGRAAWSVIPFAHPAWARQVYPDLSEEEAVDALWDDLFAVCRIDENDPTENWKKHHQSFQNRKNKINSLNLKKLHYKNSLGTDLEVELPENYRFEGGASLQDTGTVFFPNIPTEEIFGAPYKTGVNGIVYASMPLNHGGNLVEDFWFEFKDGKVVNYGAGKGEEILRSILESDPNAVYLGEAALVPAGSPIQQLNRIFYNTLLDENASCHFALGQSYGECIENGLNMEPEELEKLGMNQSPVHVDFMVGTPDLSIIGTDHDGKEIPIFTDGKFAFWFEE